MHTEIIRQINSLPIAERVEIIEEVSRSVRRDLNSTFLNDTSDSELRKKRREAVDRLRGVAKIEGKTPPTDQEAKDEYYNYLAEKYK